jgi:hypothetical protein
MTIDNTAYFLRPRQAAIRPPRKKTWLTRLRSVLASSERRLERVEKSSPRRRVSIANVQLPPVISDKEV